MKLRNFLLAGVMLGYAATAPASALYQGLTFTFIQLDPDTLTFRIQGTPSGDWTGVQYLGAFDLKGLGLDFSLVTATANGPGAVNLLGKDSQLSAANLDCSKVVGQSGSVCFDVAPDVSILPVPMNFLYTIDFSAPLSIAAAGVHLQIAFMNVEGGDKVGSLYSQDVPTNNPPPPPPPPIKVPEPGTLALFAVALLMLAALRRRQTK